MSRLVLIKLGLTQLGPKSERVFDLYLPTRGSTWLLFGSKAERFQLLNAFDMPRLDYDDSRKLFTIQDVKQGLSLHSGPQAKVRRLEPGGEYAHDRRAASKGETTTRSRLHQSMQPKPKPNLWKWGKLHYR